MLDVGTQFNPNSNCRSSSRRSSEGQAAVHGRSASHGSPAARRCASAIRYGRRTVASPPGSGT